MGVGVKRDPGKGKKLTSLWLFFPLGQLTRNGQRRKEYWNYVQEKDTFYYLKNWICRHSSTMNTSEKPRAVALGL